MRNEGKSTSCKAGLPVLHPVGTPYVTFETACLTVPRLLGFEHYSRTLGTYETRDVTTPFSRERTEHLDFLDIAEVRNRWASPRLLTQPRTTCTSLPPGIQSPAFAFVRELPTFSFLIPFIVYRLSTRRNPTPGLTLSLRFSPMCRKCRRTSLMGNLLWL